MVGSLKINHIQKVFKATDDAHTDIEALHQINTTIEPGEFISLSVLQEAEKQLCCVLLQV